MLDDANFDEAVANAAILKLFTLEEWFKNNVHKEGFDFNAAKDSMDEWDKLILNKLNDINVSVYKAYAEMKIKNVIKFGFNEMLSIKETYSIGKNGAPNPYVIMTYMTYLLTMMNPITPHFCQYSWTHYVLPALKLSTNVGRPTHEHLASCGWPTVQEAEIDRSKTIQFEYL